MSSQYDFGRFSSPSTSLLRSLDVALDSLATAQNAIFDADLVPPTPAFLKPGAFGTPLTARHTGANAPQTEARQSRSVLDGGIAAQSARRVGGPAPQSASKPPVSSFKPRSLASSLASIHENHSSTPATVEHRPEAPESGPRNLFSAFDGISSSQPSTSHDLPSPIRPFPADSFRGRASADALQNSTSTVPAPASVQAPRARSLHSASKAINDMLGEVTRHTQAIENARSPPLPAPDAWAPPPVGTPASIAKSKAMAFDGSTLIVEASSAIEKAIKELNDSTELVAGLVSSFAAAIPELKQHEASESFSASGSFSRAIHRSQAPSSFLENASLSLAMNVLPRLEHARSSVLTVQAAAAAQRSSFSRQLIEAQGQAEDARADTTAGWVAKWQNREAQWQEVVSGLRRRIVELDDAIASRAPAETTNSDQQREAQMYKEAYQTQVLELAQAKAEIAQLSEQLRRAPSGGFSSIGGIMNSNAAYQSEHDASAQATLLSFKRAAQDLQGENDKLMEERRDLRQRLLEQDQQIASLKDSLANVASAGERRRMELLDEHHATLRSLQDAQQKQQALDAAMYDVSQLKAELAACETALDTARGSLTPVEARLPLAQRIRVLLRQQPAPTPAPAPAPAPAPQSSAMDISSIHSLLSGVSEDVLRAAGLTRFSSHQAESGNAFLTESLRRALQDERTKVIQLEQQLRDSQHQTVQAQMQAMGHQQSSSGNIRSPTVGSPAHVASEVAKARAEERSAMLQDLRLSAQVVPASLDSHTAVINAQAAAAAAERENIRVQQEMRRLRDEWEREKAQHVSEVNDYQAALEQANTNMQAAIAEVAAAQETVKQSQKEAEAARNSASETRQEDAQQRDALHNTISQLQEEISRLQVALSEKQQEFSSAMSSAEMKMRLQVDAAKEDSQTALRVQLQREQERAIILVVQETEQRERARADEQLKSLVRRMETQHTVAMSKLRNDLENDMNERVEANAENLQRTVYDAVNKARVEEQEIATAKLRAQAASCDQQIAKMQQRIEDLKELAKREVERRRKIYGKVMDLQGNIRVHVRVRPTDQQLAEGLTVYEDDTSPDHSPVAPSRSTVIEDRPTIRYTTGAGALPGGRSSPSSAMQVMGQGMLAVHAPFGMLAGDWRPEAVPATTTARSAKNNRTTFEYEFDEVHGPTCSQASIFDFVRPMLERALDGFSMTVFAYGQTGSGKTYSMEGTDEHPGIAIRTMKNLFALGESKTAERSRAYGRDVEPFNFSLSIMEIYQDRVRDLLIGTTSEDLMLTGEYADPVKTIFGSDREIAAIGVGRLDDKWARNLRAPPPSTSVAGDNLAVRETSAGIEIVGLTRVAVSSARQALEAVRIASSGKSVGSHALNDRSSRSHVIIRVWVEGPGPTHVKGRVLSTINLVDLAGSERVMKTGVEGEGMKEAQAINTSLSALGNVISALRKGSSHIPFRDSKLTFALKDAMTGSSRVMMLCCVSADDANIPESMCSLTFAQRCRATALGAPERKVINAEPSESARPRSESASKGSKTTQLSGTTRPIASYKAYQDADDVASITSSLLAEDEPNGDGEHRPTVSFSNKATPDPTGLKRSPPNNTRKVGSTTTASTSPFVKARSGSTLRKK